MPRAALAAVIATASLVGITISLNLPLLSLALEGAGFGPGAIGVNTAASGLGAVLAVPLLVPLYRRLGARGTIAFGAAAAAAAMVAFPLYLDPALWFALRLVVSAGTALVFIISEAAINALAPDARRGRILALYATVFSLGYAAGPLIVAVLGSRGLAPFLASAGLFLMGAIPAWCTRRLDELFTAPPAGGAAARLLAVVREAKLAYGAILVFGVLEASMFALLPIYATLRGFAEAQGALLVSMWILGNILLQYPIGWLADRLPRRLVLASVAVAVALALLALPLMASSGLWLSGLLLLLGGCAGALYTLSLVLIGERFRGFALTFANTAFVIAIELGMVLGPPAAGLAMAGFGPAALPVGLALATVPLALAAAVPQALRGRLPDRARRPSLRGGRGMDRIGS